MNKRQENKTRKIIKTVLQKQYKSRTLAEKILALL